MMVPGMEGKEEVSGGRPALYVGIMKGSRGYPGSGFVI